MDVKSVSQPAEHPVSAPKHTERTQANRAQEKSAHESDAKQSVNAKPNPVINTQGQQTGRHLNVTA